MHGLNIDPTNPHSQISPVELKRLGITQVRFSFKHSQHSGLPEKAVLPFYQRWCETLTAARIQAVVILAAETVPGKPSSFTPNAAWRDYLTHFTAQTNHIAQNLKPYRPIFQIWQAPDSSPEVADLALNPAIFAAMLAQAYQSIKQIEAKLTVITGGLVSGQPDWLAQVKNALKGKLPADALALHPYGQRPTPNWPHIAWGHGYIGDLITAYRQVTDLPLWLTEVGIDTLSQHQQADYLSRFYKSIKSQFAAEVKQLFWFCYADSMAPGFGLVDYWGQPKPAYHALRMAAANPLTIASQPQISLEQLHHYAAYLEQNIVFGERDRTLQQQMEADLIGNKQALFPAEIQQLTQRMLTGSNHQLSSAEINALVALQSEKDLYRMLRAIVLTTHHRTGALSGRLGVHNRISAESESNAATNIAALLEIPPAVRLGNRLIIMDLVKADNDENKLAGPDVFVADTFGQLRNGLLDNHAWNFQKLAQAIQIHDINERVILLLRLDGPDEGANVNIFNADSVRKYKLALAKFTRYLEQILPTIPFKLVLGNEPDLPHERPWSDPNLDPHTFTVGHFAPAMGAFMKTLAAQRPDISYICPALSIQLQQVQVDYYRAFFGPDRPLNLMPALHGYGSDIAILPAHERSFVGDQAAILRQQHQFQAIAGTELGSGNPLFDDVETLSKKDRLDDTVAWLLLSTNHNAPLGQDNQWSFLMNPGSDDPLAQKMAHAVNRTEVRVLEHIQALSGADLQILHRQIGERLPYAVHYIDHTTPITMTPGQTKTVQILVRNTSSRTWFSDGPNRFRLGYHWYTQNGIALEASLWDDNRTALPHNIEAGDSVTLAGHLNAPRLRGDFEVRWDMVEEAITWFAWQQVPTLDIRVGVHEDKPGVWLVRASHNSISNGADNLLQAIDGNPATRWSTRALQQAGMWFEIDIQMLRLIRGLTLDTAASPQDYPRAYVIHLSQDRQKWHEVARNDHNQQALEVDFNPQLARYLRIEQIGTANNKWWSIHQITIRSAAIEAGLTVKASHNNVSSGADNLAQAIDGNPTTRWSSRALQQAGMWFEIDLNETRTVSGLALDTAGSPQDYPRAYIIRLSQDRQQWHEVARNAHNEQALEVNFNPQVAHYIQIEQTGSTNRWWWSIHAVRVRFEASTPVPVGRASHNNVSSGADNLAQAFDGNPTTRWSSRALQQAGMWFEIDLNETRTVSGLALDTAGSPQDYPRAYIIRVSQDRQQWEEVARNPHNNQAVEVNFSPRVARYLRVEQTGTADRWWWSIHGLTIRG